MSEEILKALMQLFAIISKQDDGATEAHRLFVESFLKFQLASDKVNEYLSLYDSFLTDGKEAGAEGEEKKESKLTSVKDSVRTLGICKKINKTLSQKQKVVVMVRLLEMLKKENQFTPQRIGIIDTAANVFNISSDERKVIHHFVTNDDPYTEVMEDLLIIDANDHSLTKTEEADETQTKNKHIFATGLSGFVTIIRVKSVDLYFAKYIGTNSLTINGLNFASGLVYIFAPGSNIRLPQGTVYFSDIATRFLADASIGDLTFTAKNIVFKFPGGKIGLNDVSVCEPLGKLVAIMGASGAGKTTLLNVLCGLEKPASGDITINGISLVKEPQKLDGIIGYISQDDLLIEDLTVYENLHFNARLCFANLTDAEIKTKVENTLQSLGLYEAREVKVGSPLDKKISGGQRKRLNIALELIREPTILFVDEPTSGLSSADSENVMDILKELSVKGKLIFVVIHQPSSDIYKMFDKLILMDVGGYQAYYGNPIDAITYLKKQTNQADADSGECYACSHVNPELLFNLLEAKVVNEYGQFLPERKIKPVTWNEWFKKLVPITFIKDGSKIPTKTFQIPGIIKQWLIFIARDVKSKFANTQYLVLNTLEAPFLALLLAFVIKFTATPESSPYSFRKNENLPAYLFICVIVSLFIGLTVSAEEIYRDKKILKREKFLNLSKLSYLFSKVLILFTLSAIQSAMFVAIGNYVLELKGMFLDFWLVLFAVSCFANILGLNISITFNSAVTIYILIPLLVIPQLVFGGAMFSFDKINYKLGGGQTKTPVLADVFASRWAYEGLIVNQFTDNKFERKFYQFDKDLSAMDFRQVYWVPKMNDLINQSKQQVGRSKGIVSAEDQKTALIVFNSLKHEENYFDEKDKSLFTKLNLNRIDTNFFGTADKLVNSLKLKWMQSEEEVSAKKDALVERLTDSPEKAGVYNRVIGEYTNDFLGDLVKKAIEKEKIKVDPKTNSLIQIADPIFRLPEPEHKFDYRSHFFSPKKHFMGKYFNTYGFNLSVIWLMSVLLFITLYTEFFLALGNLFGKIGSLFKPKTKLAQHA